MIKATKLVLAYLMLSNQIFSQESNDAFPRYSGNRDIDMHIHDGRIPWAIGVHSFGVFRAFNHEGKAHDKDGLGYEFNHHPNIVYWKGKYWVSYIGGPVDASEGSTPRVPNFIAYSANGRTWEAPEILFPSIKFQGVNTYMHSRMGFYVSFSGRLIAISFHGRHPSPNNGGKNGVARVAREILGVQDNGRVTFGPIYALRFNEDRNPDNTGLPLFTSSRDTGFVNACTELLGNKVVTQQWFEEDRRPESYTVNLNTKISGPDVGKEKVEAKAFDWYTLKSGRMVGWWKGSAMAYSDDGWKTTSSLDVDHQRLGEHRTAKMLGKRLRNDRYALVFCLNTQTTKPATEWSWTRTPMVVAVSDDGLHYRNDRAVVFGDIAPGRYINPPQAGGLNDNLDGGPQYVRGISESNTGKPNTNEPTGKLWTTFSVNKQDIWVSEIPLNITSKTNTYPTDNFQHYNDQHHFGDWIIISPAWAPISLVTERKNKFMRLEDKDPYDYAKAMRVFPEGKRVSIALKLRPQQTTHGLANIDITDARGNVAARIQLDSTGNISTIDNTEKRVTLTPYIKSKWIKLEIRLDAETQTYTLLVDSKRIGSGIGFYEKTSLPERFEIRTGAYRMNDYSRLGSWKDYPASTLPDAGKTTTNAVFDVDDLRIRN